MFSCVWLHFKKCFGKYFLIFGCVLENTIENTFSTYQKNFLTFSRLPNEYIILFIPQNTNKTQKKIIKSGQTKARSRLARSQSAWSRLARSQSTRSRDVPIAIAIDAFARSRDAPIAIDAFAVPVMSALHCPRCRWCQRTARCWWCRDLFFLSPSLSLLFSKAGSHLKWKWKHKWFSVVLALKFSQLEMLFSLTKFEITIKHPIFQKIISGISLKSIQTQP